MPGFLQIHNITYRRQMQACLHISIRPARCFCHPSRPRAFAARPALLPPRPALLPSAPPARLPPARRFSHPSRPALCHPPGAFAIRPARHLCHPPRPALCHPPGAFAIRPTRARLPPARRFCHPPGAFAIRPTRARLPPARRFCHPARRFSHPFPPGALICTKKTPEQSVLCSGVVEATPGIEPGNEDFADPCLTAWLCRRGGAGDGARTRHLSLGKAALYQMSYSRRSAATAAGLVHPQGLEPWTP